VDRMREACNQPVNDGSASYFVDTAGEEGELVPAEPRDGVGTAHMCGHAAAQGPQHLVASRVTMVVVDQLEAVEVDEDQRDGPLVFVGQDGFEGFGETKAVSEPREIVDA